jgi:hypothetical protein
MVAGLSPAALRSSKRSSCCISHASGLLSGWRSFRLVRPIVIRIAADLPAAILGAATWHTPIAFAGPPAAIACCSSPISVMPKSTAAARAASVRSVRSLWAAVGVIVISKATTRASGSVVRRI